MPDAIPIPTHSPEELVARVLDGCKTSETELFGLIQAYLRRSLHLGDDSWVKDPVDALQEVVTSVFKYLERFDPSKASFRTWSYQVAKNCLRDYLDRIRSTPSRSMRERLLAINQFCSEYAEEHRSQPSQDDICAKLGITAQQYLSAIFAEALCAATSLDSPLGGALGEDGCGLTLHDVLDDPTQPTPAEDMEQNEAHSSVRAAMKLLNEADQTLLRLYYFEDVQNYAEIARRTGIHAVHQKLPRALNRLREILAPTPLN